MGTLYYLTLAAGAGVDEELWGAGTLVIALSTLVHGMTAAPGRELFPRVQRSS